MDSGTARKADTGKTVWRYERRRPERTLLYQLVAEHYPRFLELLADQGRPEVMSQVLGIVYRAIETHLIQQAGGTRATAKTGAVTLIQRFGSALNLNIHFHMLFLDGAYLAIFPTTLHPHAPFTRQVPALKFLSVAGCKRLPAMLFHDTVNVTS